MQGMFVIDHWESLNDDYVLTLRAWRAPATKKYRFRRAAEVAPTRRVA